MAYIGFAGDEDETLTFDQGIAAARSMLNRLGVLSQTLIATKPSNSPENAMAQSALRYANTGGPAMLQRAVNEKSLARLEDVQATGLNIVTNIREALADAVITRFFFATILGPLSLIPGSSELLKDQVDNATDKLAPGARKANDFIHTVEEVAASIFDKVAKTATGEKVDPVVVGVGVLATAAVAAYVFRSFR